MKKNESGWGIGDKLRNLRVETDFSQESIAKTLHLSRSSYTYYETGKTIPNIEVLYKLSILFGVPMEYFFESDFRTEGKQRPRKKVQSDPKKIGDLLPKEKELIAMVRLLRDEDPEWDSLEVALGALHELEDRRKQASKGQVPKGQVPEE